MSGDGAAGEGVGRRSVLTGGAAAVGLLAIGAPGAAALPSAAGVAGADGAAGEHAAAGPLGFAAVPAGEQDAVVVPEGYTAAVLAPWGAPVHPGGPKWRPGTGPTGAEQSVQVGSHHHGVSYFPLGARTSADRRGLLVISHESYDPEQGGGPAAALAGQGLTVVEVRESGGTWRLVDSGHNRRITGDTPVTWSGPVTAAHPELAGDGEPRGVLAASGQGVTPWGTCLAGEENFNAFFGTSAAGWTSGEREARYDLSASGFGHPWHESDARFDLAARRHEAHRFGWIVEIDPRDAGSAPVKRTALGRLMHAGATVTEARGRAVVYGSDAEDGEYLYKFVSADGWRRMRARGRSPLDHGTLYVARFAADGSGRWLPLVHGQGPLTAVNGWRDQADVLLWARLAADAVGATALSRPEQITVNPRNGDVYLALPNGSGDSCCEAGGTGTGDRYGRVLRWREDDRDATAAVFRWDEFASAGEHTAPATVSATAGGGPAFASPKGVWFDGTGRLWISTGVSGYALNREETGHGRTGNNALLAADPRTGEIRRFLTGPRGCEITGVSATPDGRTLFVNVQHPGRRTTRWGVPDARHPTAVSTWPDGDPAGRPRSATIAVRRDDGGPVGG
jgi:secreted PhoX family phosphatase